MAGSKQIIELYTELAEQPNKDFGWDKGCLLYTSPSPRDPE